MVEDRARIDVDARRTEELFAQFAITDSYAKLQQKIFDLLVENRHSNSNTIDNLRSRFVGALFEELTFDAMGGIVEPQVLLPPHSTYEYFQQYLYPHAPLSPHTFTDSLDGISVPDGILLTVGDEESFPQATYEYTLRQGENSQVNHNYFRHKYHAHRWRQREFPHLFSGTPLVFVTPSKPGLAEQIQTVGNGDIEVVQLPFSHKAFGVYADRIFRPLLADAGISRRATKTTFKTKG